MDSPRLSQTGPPRVRSPSASSLKEERIHRLLAEHVRMLDAALPDVPPHLRVLLQTIHANLYVEGLNSSRARARCNLLNHNVCTEFKQQLGLGIRAYIERARMEAAALLLSHPDLEIYLIGIEIGYRNQETFTRAFNRQYGCPPSAFRRRRGAGSAE